MKPPITYSGGKTSLAERISELLPEHRHYVEPFAGSLAVLLAKAPSRMETVNDLDGELMGFWRMLRDRPVDLARVCALTPHARAEQEVVAFEPVPADHPDPELEASRRVWVRLTQGRSGTLRRTGWRHYVDPGTFSTSMPRYLLGYLERMMPVAERLAQVSLECRPALELIASYGRHRSVLLYVDPPYLGSTRARNYRHEMMNPAEHHELAAALRSCRATVVLSGYASELYDQELYADWHRHTFDTGTSQGGQWEARTEVLWSNRPLRGDAALFEASPNASNETPVEASGCNGTLCQGPRCEIRIQQPVTGRPRRFCSTACRVQAHRMANR
jgi:DNA adenine methylase